jgi:hypothetical protein
MAFNFDQQLLPGAPFAPNGSGFKLNQVFPWRRSAVVIVE